MTSLYRLTAKTICATVYTSFSIEYQLADKEIESIEGSRKGDVKNRYNHTCCMVIAIGTETRFAPVLRDGRFPGSTD